MFLFNKIFEIVYNNNSFNDNCENLENVCLYAEEDITEKLLEMV